MKEYRRWVCAVALAPLLVAGLAACVVAPAQPYYAAQPVPYDAGPVVAVAPPAPQVEYVGPPPIVGQVWIGGYWNWVGGRHVWVGGHYAAPPHAGYHWVPHRWVQEGGNWRLHQGHWQG